MMLLTIGVEPKEPPRVERCEPILYRFNEFDPAVIQAKTQEGRFFFWYRAPSANGWYYDMDAESGNCTSLVIHHSAGPPISPEEISEVGKEKLYLPYFDIGDKNHVTTDPALKGLPVHSWHVVKKPGENVARETFSGYHHLIYPDGTVTTELSPLRKVGNRWVVDMVAWHSGNWQKNCHSLAVCLIGDFTKTQPTAEQIQATLELIAYYRILIPDLEIMPHNSIVPTECPGSAWELLKQMLKIP